MKIRSEVSSGRFCWATAFKAAALSVSMGLCGAFASSAAAQAPNDEAATAQELDVLSNQNSGSYIVGALHQDATASSGAPSCSGGAYADVWYRVPTFSLMTVTAHYWTDTLSSGSMSIYTGPSASQLTEKACVVLVAGAASGQIDYTTAEGETAVWIRVASANAAQNGQFFVWAFQVMDDPGTTSDNCGGASWFDGSLEPITGAILDGATASPGQPAGLSVPDIWYTVNARSVTVEYDDGATTGPGFVTIYSGWGSGLSSIGYSAVRGSDGKFRATALLGMGEHGEGLTGMVRVGSASTSVNQSLRIIAYAPNDLTAAPQEIDLQAGQPGCDTVSGRVFLSATSPGYAVWGDDYWASCADPDSPTVWYHVPVAPGQTVTADYLTPGTGSVSIWSGENQYELVEQDCTAVSPTSTQTSASYTAGTGETGVWIQISGDDTWQSVDLDVCLSQ